MKVGELMKTAMDPQDAKEWFGTTATQCRSVDQLLGLKEVDAVFIASA